MLVSVARTAIFASDMISGTFGVAPTFPLSNEALLPRESFEVKLALALQQFCLVNLNFVLLCGSFISQRLTVVLESV